MKKLPQAVILAAGESSRMFPYTDFSSHKSMIEVGGKPILQYLLEELKKNGLKDIILVVNKNDADIQKYFKNGKELGLSLKYAFQKEPKGMGNALLAARNYIKSDFCVINPNHINLSEFLPSTLRAFTLRYQGVLLGAKTKEPWRYGVLKTKGDKILEILEKPKRGKEPSQIRVVGLYLLKKDFLNTLSKIPSQKYQLEVALNQFFKKNQVRLLSTSKETLSLKYPLDLLQVKEFLAKKLKRFVSPKASISRYASLQGPVVVEEGARIFEGAVLKGPVYIGKNVVVGNYTLIRENTFLEEGVKIGAMNDIKNSLFMKNSSLHSVFIGDSIIGENTKIGAGFVTANRRFDRGEIFAYFKKGKIPTGRNYLGALIGNNVQIGIQCGTMPGVIIGSNSIIYPGTMVYKNIPENSIIKKFS